MAPVPGLQTWSHTRVERTRREEGGGRRDSFLLSKQDKGCRSPSVGMKRADVCLRPPRRAPIKEHEERKLQTKPLSDLLVHLPICASILWWIYCPAGRVNPVRERTEKMDSEVMQSLTEGFFLHSTSNNPNRMASIKAHYVENLGKYRSVSRYHTLPPTWNRGDLASPPRFA